MAKRQSVTVTSDASGDANTFSTTVNGRILAVEYTKTDYDNGVDFTITTETTGINVWVESDVNASKSVSPRRPTHSQLGVAALFAAGGLAVLGDHVYAHNERIRITIAQAGNTKVGTFVIETDEP